MTFSGIIRNFDAAAKGYDRAASAQAAIAARLVAWAAESGVEPGSILDSGCGTGLVAEELQRRWPQAKLTALDASRSMLEEAQRKLPQLSVLTGDILTLEPGQKFDAIFSSMALHWLPDPLKILNRWQGWLKPQGRLFAAVPVDGSFLAWRERCRRHGIRDGLWPLPSADFADRLAARTAREAITIAYPSARDFLRSMKLTGASTPRPGYKPASAATMRHLLNADPGVFSASYDLVLLELRARTPAP